METGAWKSKNGVHYTVPYFLPRPVPELLPLAWITPSPSPWKEVTGGAYDPGGAVRFPGFPSVSACLSHSWDWGPLQQQSLWARPQFKLHALHPADLCLPDQKVLSKREKKQGLWTSLVVQWIRIRLPVQGTRVPSLIREDPTCCGATKPVCHSYWACALELTHHSYWSPHVTTTEAHTPRAHAPQQEKPLQWEASVPQRRVAPAHHN